MRLKDRLIDLCLLVLADTAADLAGILEEIRAVSEDDRVRPVPQASFKPVDAGPDPAEGSGGKTNRRIGIRIDKDVPVIECGDEPDVG